ncbi:MAG: endonuclease/exonuclease/phosphatase family protein [Candidatus Acidoferrales bacterium]
MALFFKSPKPKHKFSVAREKKALTEHFKARKVPRSRPKRLLVASWNVANLGVQGRTAAARKLIAHILKRFDLIAMQEVKDNFQSFLDVVKRMGPAFDYVMTDTAGNEERLAFVYRKKKVKLRYLFGELALRAREFPRRNVTVRWQDKNKKPRVQKFKNFRFQPFDRNPFIGSFAASKVDFLLVNVHLYFGKFQNSKTEKDRERYARRVLEIYALSRWADRRFERETTYDKDIVLLGDMNVPKRDKKDSAYKALTAFQWNPINYLEKKEGPVLGTEKDAKLISQVGGSNLGNDKTYDQMVFAPGAGGLTPRIQAFGIFDFDNAIFQPLWKELRQKLSHGRAAGKFRAHVKHHLSDHRPLWLQLATH